MTVDSDRSARRLHPSAGAPRARHAGTAVSAVLLLMKLSADARSLSAGAARRQWRQHRRRSAVLLQHIANDGVHSLAILPGGSLRRRSRHGQLGSSLRCSLGLLRPLPIIPCRMHAAGFRSPNSFAAGRASCYADTDESRSHRGSRHTRHERVQVGLHLAERRAHGVQAPPHAAADGRVQRRRLVTRAHRRSMA